MLACNNNQGIQFNCKYHKEYKPSYINLINSQENVLLCMLCLEQQQLNNNQFYLSDLQSIETLIQSSSETILPKWPILNNQGILLQIHQQNRTRLSQMQQQQTISQYFDNLRKEINQVIDQIYKDTMKKFNEILPQQDDILLKFYNDIAQKEKVKDIFMKNNISFDDANNQAKEILKVQHLNKETNEDKLLNLMNKFNGKERFDISRPNQLKEEIIKMIKNINFYTQIQEQQIQKTLNPQTCFYVSRFSESQNDLSSEYLDDQSIIFSKKKNNNYLNTILSTFSLENSKTYKIVFTLDANQSSSYIFFVGLTSKGEIEELFKNNYSFCIAFKDCNNKHGVDKVIKGFKDKLRYNYQQFELKINISSGILEISDFPNHDNIIGINDDRKIDLQRETQLKIAFSIYFTGQKLIINSFEENFE